MFRSRRYHYGDGMLRWLRLLWIAWLAPIGSATSNAGTRAVLTVSDFAPFAFACEISNYGAPLQDAPIYRAILMRPPGDLQLCTFPPSLANADSNLTLPVKYPSDLALVVSLGGCDVYQKTDIALQLHERASPSIKYIVFYNNDPGNTDGIVPLLPPDPSSGIAVPDNIRKLAFLSASTSVGVNLLALIERHAEGTGNSPDFLRQGNRNWNLEMLVERLAASNNTPTPQNPYATNTRVNGGNFYWFRFILFALLIIAPCCRGAYLWWNGGGRIYFRRNENGRIVGLQYISPISYWFASNGVQDVSAPITDRLTEEQVMALPEITFKGAAESDAKAKEENADGGEDPPLMDDVDIIISSGSADGNEQNNTLTLDRVASISESVRSDEEEMAEGNFPTNCTTCSICIDEFEPGERLRFLPRCKHAFHTECIMPWLTERQGCCPLCKTTVMEQEGDEGIVPDTTTDVEPTVSHEDTGTEQDSLGVGAALSNEDSGRFSSSNDNAESLTRISNPGLASSESAFSSRRNEDQRSGEGGDDSSAPEGERWHEMPTGSSSSAPRSDGDQAGDER